MSKIINILTPFFCLVLLSCSHSKDVIVVQYIDSSGADFLSSPCFVDFEIIPLQGAESPLLGPIVNMIVKNNTYYISDPLRSGKVYLYHSNGNYLNSVGEMGRGPNEYLILSDLIVEEDGNITVYSSYQGMLFTYTPQGLFLESTEFDFKSANYNRIKGFNYHYLGEGSGMPYQLYIFDNQNNVIDSYLSSSDVPHFSTFSPVFTLFEDSFNFCPAYGNEVYRLMGSKLSVSYTFNFGEYTIPAEYFQKERNDTMAFIMSKTVATKELFFENQKYAILRADVCDFKEGFSRQIYGLLEKAKPTWKWYYINSDDFMNNYNLKYMDDSYIYFMVEPASIKETALIDIIPSLSNYAEEDGIVIMKCKLK